LLALLISSCNKPANDEPLISGSVLLAEVKLSNSANNTVFFRTCTYDRNDRLTYMSSTDKNGVQRGGYEVSYPAPNTVRLTEWVEQSNVYGNEVTFVLDEKGRPTARYQHQFFRRDNPNTWSESFDSTFFQYGSQGLLEFSYARNRDTVNAPGVPNGGVFSRHYKDTTYFTNAGGNLVSTRSIGKDSIIRYDRGVIATEVTGRRETISFDYALQVRRGDYGKNGFLYQELNIVGIKPHPFHLPYQQIANKVAVVRDEQDRVTGQWNTVSIESTQYEPSTVFAYNQLDLVTRMTYTDVASGIRYFTDFTYR
jgi:hypothetical protein